MTSLKGDIVNRVKRLPKPSQAAAALQPVFEAVSNALHAIEDAYGEDFQSKGKILVTFANISTPDNLQVDISDNGIGLDNSRFEAFCTTDTDFKLPKGGKGVGRLLWLDAFEEISVQSHFLLGDQLYARRFRFILRESDQIIDEQFEEIHGTKVDIGTVISFKGLRGEAYRTKFPSQSATIIRHFGSHFFADFILGRAPQVIVDIAGEETIFPDSIQNLQIEDRGTAQLETADFGELEISSFVCDKRASANFDGLHQLHLVANGRTVTTRKIDGLVGIGRFGPQTDRVFHGCVSGQFLDERVNQERTQFNFDENIIDQIVKECADHVRTNAIHDEVANFDATRLHELREFISDYPSFGFEEAEHLLERTPKNATKAEQFAQALIPIRIRRDKDRNDKIEQIISQLERGGDIPDDFAGTIKSAANEIRAEEQRQLTEYILRRKVVLDVMQVLIRRIRDRGDGIEDFHLEETLHKFICPMRLRGDDPSKVECSDHDLWIIDERLTFTKYFASDLPFSNVIDQETCTQRADLLVYDRLHGLGAEGEDPLRRAMLVEFKKPGRKDYHDRYSPQNQISEYITKLQRGEIEDFRGQRVRIAEDCIFYCYVIADIVGKLEIHTNGWRTTSDGRGRIQDLNGKFRGVIEIIEWADLLSDARLRNLAFLDAAGLKFKV